MPNTPAGDEPTEGPPATLVPGTPPLDAVPDATLVPAAPPASDAAGTMVPAAPPPLPPRKTAFPKGAGRYVIQGEIARGGMGVVYRAADPQFGREVAVKLVQTTGGEMVRRFVDEAQITGQLQHPGIPPVYEVGELPDGRPFLAMKLIRGQTLDALLKARPDPSADRGRFLAVFEQVCHAVGYAHANGVVHRDLKPANVMVGAFGEVQVMDWGLAKVLANRPAVPAAGPGVSVPRAAGADPELTDLGTGVRSTRDAADMTEAGSFLGTPAFMPPEQATGAVDQTDARSDVFGLGGILCVILTGKPPYTGPTAETTRQIAAAADQSDAFTRLDACRAEPDLVALCKWCLAPARDDRPADGGAVAAEVAALRAAADERVRQAEADRHAAEVRAGEERKRRRVLLAAAAAVAAVLAVGAGVSAWQAVRAKAAEGEARTAEGRARDEAERARVAEAAAKAGAETARVAGEKEHAARTVADLKTAEAVKEREEAKRQADAATASKMFLMGVLNQSSAQFQAVLGQAPNPNLTLVEALTFSAKELDSAFADLPLIEADLRHAIGVSFHYLSRHADAERHFRRALTLYEKHYPPDEIVTLRTITNLGSAIQAQGRVAESIPFLQRAATLWEKRAGPDDPDTLVAVGHLGAALSDARRHDEAEPLLRRTLAGFQKVHGPDHPHTLTTASHLAQLLRLRGKPEEAEPLFRMVLARREKALGRERPETLFIAHRLAVFLLEQRRLAEAEPLFRRTFAGMQKTLGPDHESTLSCANNFAQLLRASGQADKAIPILTDLLPRCDRVLGPGHGETIHAATTLGLIHYDADRLDQAVPLLERAWRLRNKHGYGNGIRGFLMNAYERQERWADAAAIGVEMLPDARRQLKPDDPDFDAILIITGRGLLESDPAAAEPLLRECMTIREKMAPGRWPAAFPRSLLGDALLRQGKAAEAEPLLRAAYDTLRANLLALPAPIRWSIPETAERLVRVNMALKKPDEVAKWHAERAKYPPDVAPPPRAVSR